VVGFLLPNLSFFATSTMMFVAALLLTCVAQTLGADCGDASAISTKSQSCITQMTSNIGGGVCNAWNGYICCVKDAFAGCDMDSKIDSVVNTMKTMYSGQPGFADISSCAAATCSGGSSSGSTAGGAPSPVETTLTAKIEVIDPTTFSIEIYIDAVKNKTGSTAVTAEVKLWEVALVYSVPDATTEAALKAAIVKAMGLAEADIKVVIQAAGSRRLGDKRRLAANAAVTMTTVDAAKAKALMTESSDSAKINDLETELGGSVTATKPTAKAKVETKVTTDPSKVDALTTQLVEAGSDLGLTVTATVGSSSEDQTSNSTWSFLFAPLLILLIKTIQ